MYMKVYTFMHRVVMYEYIRASTKLYALAREKMRKRSPVIKKRIGARRETVFTRRERIFLGSPPSCAATCADVRLVAGGNGSTSVAVAFFRDVYEHWPRVVICRNNLLKRGRAVIPTLAESGRRMDAKMGRGVRILRSRCIAVVTS